MSEFYGKRAGVGGRVAKKYRVSATEKGCYRSIQQALQAAPAGAEVYVLPGQYVESLYFPVPVSLRAEAGRDTVWIDIHNSPSIRVQQGVPWVDLRDLCLRNWSGRQTNEYSISVRGYFLQVEHCNLQLDRGLLVYDRGKVVIVDSLVHTSLISAIYIHGEGASGELRKTEVKDNGGTGLVLKHSSAKVSNSTFSGNGDNDLFVDQSSEATIEGSRFERTGRDQVAAGNGSRITVRASTFAEGAKSGLIVVTRSEGSVEDCEFSASGRAGIWCDGTSITIEATGIRDCKGPGIFIQGDSTATIEGVTATANEVGLSVHTTGLVTVRGSNLGGNRRSGIFRDPSVKTRVQFEELAEEPRLMAMKGREPNNAGVGDENLVYGTQGGGSIAWSPVGEVLAKLDALIGLQSVKDQVRESIDKVELSKRRVAAGLKPLSMSHHLIFAGPPGTGKTTVAGLYSELLAALGVLPQGQFIKAVRSDLVAETIGATANQTRRKVEEALGGVLFIDEVYTLAPPDAGRDFGQEAIDTLVEMMEVHRDELVVIVAGYSNLMSRFLKSNPGLKSRFNDQIDFPNYTVAELLEVFDRGVADGGYFLSLGARDGIRQKLERMPRGSDFGNAREVRKLLEEVEGRMASRLREDPGAKLTTITLDDIKGARIERPRDEDRVAAILERVDAMVGLASVKEQMHSLVASIELNEKRKAKGLPVAKLTEHLIFAGSPGTGKSTIAETYGQLLHAMGVLDLGGFEKADRGSLVAGWQGQTALRVKEAFAKARGGVLFIDEVYALNTGERDSFGQEAIATLVKEMEDHRDDVVVIVAGYTEQMQRFLDTNPGLTSRLGRTIMFEDYTSEELAQILVDLAQEEGYDADDDVANAVRRHFEEAPRGPNFGNGRAARNLFKDAKKNLAKRHAADASTDTSVLLPEDISPTSTSSPR